MGKFHNQTACTLVEYAPEGTPYRNASTDQSSRIRLTELFYKHEATLQSESPRLEYYKILAQTYSRLAAEVGVSAEGQQVEAFGNSAGEWPAFPDTVEAMTRLGKYYKLVALTNFDRESFARTNAGLLNGVVFCRAYPARDIGSYKPDLRNFGYLLKHLDGDHKSEGVQGINRDENLHVAQNLFHDHKPAKQMRISSVWINRKGASTGSWSGLKQMHDDEEVEYGWKFNTIVLLNATRRTSTC